MRQIWGHVPPVAVRAYLLSRDSIVNDAACGQYVETSSSAMAVRPRELDQRFQMGVNLRLL